MNIRVNNMRPANNVQAKIVPVDFVGAISVTTGMSIPPFFSSPPIARFSNFNDLD
jgi:hypothetical protein